MFISKESSFLPRAFTAAVEIFFDRFSTNLIILLRFIYFISEVSRSFLVFDVVGNCLLLLKLCILSSDRVSIFINVVYCVCNVQILPIQIVKPNERMPFFREKHETF